MPSKPSITRKKTKTDSLALLRAIIQRELSRSPHAYTHQLHCPHCGSPYVTKRGHDATGKQRFACKTCRRSFTAATGSVLSSTNIPLDTWLAFVKCCVDKQTLRDSAKQCNISLKTAFYMKRRLGRVIGEYSRHVKQALRNKNA